MAIKDILSSSDPLSNDAFQMIINYREEDMYVDYKESIEPNNNKHWLEITKDVLAFSNTHGGYIVIGVRYTPFEVVGIDERVVEFLTDTNNILQKLNRYVEPAFTGIRTKKYVDCKKNIVVIYVPESKGTTHVIVKEGNYKKSDGNTDIILRPGMIFFRSSATNHIITSADLEFILSKRLDHYKESIFNRVMRVINEPIERELVFLDSKTTSQEAKKIKISDPDDPEAIKVKGLNVAAPPKNDNEEIASWIALKTRDESFTPSSERLWYIYSKRLTLKETLIDDQIKELLRLNLLKRIPPFYWLQFVHNEDAKSIIQECLKYVDDFNLRVNILHVGAFKGKTFYKSLLRVMGKDVSRLNPRSRKYPKEDPISYFHSNIIDKMKKDIKLKKSSTEDLEKKLDYLVSKCLTSPTSIYEGWEIEAIDCFLYSPKNNK